MARIPTYRAEDVEVREFDESVRARPGMYFGVARTNPELPTRVLSAVLGHALHPATSVAPAHTPRVTAQIHADLAFTVEDDQSAPWDGAGEPGPGYHGSLLGPERWLSAAAAALSSRTVVEVWRDGRGFRQKLAGTRPVAAARRFDSRPGAGTRVTFELDPAYFAPGAAVTTDPATLDLHGPGCRATAPAPGQVTIRDLRTTARG